MVGGAVLPAEVLASISGFARYVDGSAPVKARIAAAADLQEVVGIAHQQGFSAVNVALLVDVLDLLQSADWIWRQRGQRWSDHLFVFSLVMLLTGKDGAPAAKPVAHSSISKSSAQRYSEAESARFIAYARANTRQIQPELKASHSLEDVLSVAHAHGFCLSRGDFLLNKHDWRDAFFPWAGRSTHEIRLFLHAGALDQHLGQRVGLPQAEL